MNVYSLQLLQALVRGTLMLTVFAGVVLLLNRFLPIRSIAVRRFLWCAVVLQGCLFVRIPVTLPSISFLQKPILPIEVEQSESSSLLQIPKVAILFGETLYSEDAEPEVRETRARPVITWAMGITVLWLVGIAVVVGRGLWYYTRFVRGLPKRQSIRQEWIDEWETLLREANVKHRAVLRLSIHVGPLLCWHPTGYQLIVPRQVWELLEPRRRMLILRHELAHLVRNDIWKSFVIRLLALPQWFNPLAWWAVRQFDEDAERACDDAVRRPDESVAFDYARTLLLLGGSHGGPILGTQAVSGHGLADRIRRLLVSNSRKDSNMKKLTITALMLGLSSLHLLRFQSLAEDQPRPAPVEPVTEFTGDVSITTGDVVLTADSVHILQPSPASVRTEAVIDLKYVFPNLAEFRLRRYELDSLLARREKEIIAEMKALKKDDQSADPSKLAVIDEKRKEYSQEISNQEQEIYRELYKKIWSEAKDYAKENGIRVVRNVERTRRPLWDVDANTRNLDEDQAKGPRHFVIGAVSANPATGIVYTENSVRLVQVPNPQKGVVNTVEVQFSDGTTRQGLAVMDSLKIVTAPDTMIMVGNSTAVNSVEIGTTDAKGIRKEPPEPVRNVNRVDGKANGGTISFVAADDNKPSAGSAPVAAAQNLSVDLVSNGSPAVFEFGLFEGPETTTNVVSILNKEVVYADSDDELDITSEILSRMNKKYGAEQSAKKSD